jgi:hypothetical protein
VGQGDGDGLNAVKRDLEKEDGTDPAFQNARLLRIRPFAHPDKTGGDIAFSQDFHDAPRLVQDIHPENRHVPGQEIRQVELIKQMDLSPAFQGRRREQDVLDQRNIGDVWALLGEEDSRRRSDNKAEPKNEAKTASTKWYAIHS